MSRKPKEKAPHFGGLKRLSRYDTDRVSGLSGLIVRMHVCSSFSQSAPKRIRSGGAPACCWGSRAKGILPELGPAARLTRSNVDAHRTSLHEEVRLRELHILFTNPDGDALRVGMETTELVDGMSSRGAIRAGSHARGLQPLLETVDAHVALRHRGLALSAY